MGRSSQACGTRVGGQSWAVFKGKSQGSKRANTLPPPATTANYQQPFGKQGRVN